MLDANRIFLAHLTIYTNKHNNVNFMNSNSPLFKKNAVTSLNNQQLQEALARAKSGFIDKRRKAMAAFPEFDTLRQQAKTIKDHTLKYLDFYLEQFEEKVTEHGGQMHWAKSAEEACKYIVDICQSVDAQSITKGKTMIGEEVGLNAALEKAGLTVTETDLGEYIIQLAKEPPSHIIAPAVHKTREQIAELFQKHHQKPVQTEIPALVAEARAVLREKFLAADVGITGANFLVAETGSVVLITNEGNGDLTNTLPRTHIVITSIEKVVPTLEDLTAILRLLGRSASGQAMTAYSTLSTGPKRPEEKDGPENFHIILVDNGRSHLLGGEFQDMLRCIRCGACLNHCPVYGSIGGHAYGWVYPGPMGSILTPLLSGLPTSCDLPNASSLCGRCQDMCPMHIPLPRMLRTLRNQAHEQKLTSWYMRWPLSAWAWLATRPKLYRTTMSLTIWVMKKLGHQGKFSYLPLAGGWTNSRDFPAPQGQTFMSQWKNRSS